MDKRRTEWTDKPSRGTGFRLWKTNKPVLIVAGWLSAAVLFASQWYIYDAIHHQAARVIYYLSTSAYLCGVLTPVVVWLASRSPIDSRTWKRALPLHIAVSLVLTGVGIFIEAAFGWLPHAAESDFSATLRHYYAKHTQISLVTYWVLLAAAQVYRMYDQARNRELHAAQLEVQLAEAQSMALRAQLQPHFLFNTLQAATMLIYKDPQGAEEILLSLSDLLRISLQALRQQEVPLSREIEFLKHYTSIQQRRFGDRLRIDFKIEPALGGCAVPTLVLQPLVENAICHGIGKHREPDVVSVRAFSSDEQLHLEVSNLNSLLDDAPERLFSRGVGLANTLARLEQLYGTAQTFQIRNLHPRGVMVLMSMPLRPLVAVENELVEEGAR